MSLARTYPSLLTRINENESRAKLVTRRSYLGEPAPESYADRYRGTKYDTRREPVVVSGPSVSRGRALLLVSGSAVAVVTGVVLAAVPT
ncbi:MAG: hypothetical protein PVG27_00200 [Chloroflexota bacterium]|jgi:hypothetical protein